MSAWRDVSLLDLPYIWIEPFEWRWVMPFFESPLFPNLIYLLLMAGLWFAALAVVSPGTGLLELLALVSLAAVGLATSILPLNIWAVVMLIAGGILFVISLQRERPEVWLSASALVLSLGSVFMFEVEDGLIAVHPLVALVVSVLTLGYFWFAIRKAVVAQQANPSIDPARVIDQIGEVRTKLDPIGSVYVLGELWTARAEKPIEPGAEVKVVGREGLMLVVESME
jgi:membrane-bound serine protease (ClpP class)